MPINEDDLSAIDLRSLPRLKSKSKKRIKRYSGILAKPIQVGLWARSDYSEQLWLRTEVLAIDLGVSRFEEDFWLKMFMALAKRHVPAFELETSSSRKTKSKSDLPGAGVLGALTSSEEKLRQTIDAMKAETGLSVVACCKNLANQRGRQFSTPPGKDAKKHRKTLHRRYYAEIKRVRRIAA